MATGNIIVGAERADRTSQRWSPNPEAAWGLLLPVGVLFVVAGFIDLGLALFPPQFALTEWRFSAANIAVTGWPLVLVGATILAAGASVGRGAVAVAWAALGLNVLCLTVMLLSVASLLGGWDEARSRVPAALTAGLGKGVVKGMISATLYSACHLLSVRAVLRGVGGAARRVRGAA